MPQMQHATLANDWPGGQKWAVDKVSSSNIPNFNKTFLYMIHIRYIYIYISLIASHVSPLFSVGSNHNCEM